MTIRSETRDYLVDPGAVPEGSILAVALSDDGKEGEARMIDLRHRDPELIALVVAFLRGRSVAATISAATLRDLAGEAAYLGMDVLEAQLTQCVEDADKRVCEAIKRAPLPVEFAFDGRFSPPGAGSAATNGAESSCCTGSSPKPRPNA